MLNLSEEDDLRVHSTFRDALWRFQADLVHVNHLRYLSTNIRGTEMRGKTINEITLEGAVNPSRSLTASPSR